MTINADFVRGWFSCVAAVCVLGMVLWPVVYFPNMDEREALAAAREQKDSLIIVVGQKPGMKYAWQSSQGLTYRLNFRDADRAALMQKKLREVLERPPAIEEGKP